EQTGTPDPRKRDRLRRIIAETAQEFPPRLIDYLVYRGLPRNAADGIGTPWHPGLTHRSVSCLTKGVPAIIGLVRQLEPHPDAIYQTIVGARVIFLSRS